MASCPSLSLPLTLAGLPIAENTSSESVGDVQTLDQARSKDPSWDQPE